MTSHFTEESTLVLKYIKFEDVEHLIEPEPNSGCWIWKGCYDKNGYGTRRVWKKDEYNRNWFAHRLLFIFENKGIPLGKQINHKCDNHYCVNPNHLYAGTQGENMKDTIGKPRKKTDRSLDNAYNRKLSLKEAREIQERYDKSEMPMQIHKDYLHVGISTIKACCRRQNWK